jgi:sirohydrochlorin ferrochelatase
MNARAVLLCGHGARDADGLAEFGQLVQAIRSRLPDTVVEHAYLEFAEPTIVDALDALRQRGFKHVVAAPVMLMAARHVQEDIPGLIGAYRTRHAEMTIQLADALGLEGQVLEAAAERIASVADAVADSTLVVVGRGAGDTTLVADVQLAAERLRRQLGFASALTCFCGIAQPTIEQGLELALARGATNVVVFPLLLFTGKLVQRVYRCVDDAATRHPEICFRKAPYLGTHPLIVQAVQERIARVFSGKSNTGEVAHVECRNER